MQQSLRVPAGVVNANVRGIGSCCTKGYFAETEHGDRAFSVRTIHLRYGAVLEEVGLNASSLLNGKKKARVAFFTDAKVRETPHFAMVKKALEAEGFDIRVFSEVRVEPTDASFMQAAAWCKDVRPELAVSLGGGSVMDTAKAALLYSTFPPPDGDFLHVSSIQSWREHD